MTQAKFENLSELVDAENTENGIWDELATDKELASRWQSYHLIRDGLRNELPDNLHLNIADAVAEALENEPTVIAPQKTADEKSVSRKRGNVIKPLFGNVAPLFRQGGQFAIAASVALAVIVGYQQINYTQQNSDLNIAPVKAVTGIQSGLSPVSLSNETALPQTSQSVVVEQRRKLNALMADHQQQMIFKTSESEEEVSEERKAEKDAQQK